MITTTATTTDAKPVVHDRRLTDFRKSPKYVGKMLGALIFTVLFVVLIV